MTGLVQKTIADAGGTVSTTALALTDAPFSFTEAQLYEADEAHISSSGNLRYRTSGSDPTGSVGHRSNDFKVYGQDIVDLRVIRAGGADRTVFITLRIYR